MKKYSLLFVAFLIVAFCGLLAFSSSMRNPSEEMNSACPKNLAGKWTGKYFYNKQSNDFLPTNFTFFVSEVSGNHFSGHIIEPRTNWGPENLKEFESSVEGSCEGSNINFVKTYNFPRGHSVNYSGKLKGSVISGKWVMGPNWSGSWTVEKE